MGSYSRRNMPSQNNIKSVITELTQNNKNISFVAEDDIIVKGYAPKNLDKNNNISWSLMDDLSWDTKENEAAIISFFNYIAPKIQDRIKEIDQQLPQSFIEQAGSLSDFFNNGVIGDRETFEQFVYKEIIQAVETTYQNSYDTGKLIDYYKIKSSKTIAKEREKLEKKLFTLQESIINNSETTLSGIKNILSKSFPGIQINSDGSFDISQLDYTNINFSGEEFKNIGELIKTYKKNVCSQNFVNRHYSYKGLNEYQDYLGGNSPLPRANQIDAYAETITSDSNNMVTFLGILSSFNKEVVRDNERGHRFVSGEKFWPNDYSGGMYSTGLGKCAIMTPNIVKMAFLLSDYESNYYNNSIAEVWEREPDKLINNIVAVIDHEYAHRISQHDFRTNIEKSSGVEFKEIGEIFNKIKATVPNEVSNGLINEAFGSYAMHSASEFYSEAFRFLHYSDESRENARWRFTQAGLETEFKKIIKAVGL